MQGYTLNVELVSNDKFSKEELADIKNLMESREDLIAFYSLFSESICINFSNHIEIYIEDFQIENDLQQEIGGMIKDLDSLIPGGLVNDSKIEWTSSISPIRIIWYKDNDSWIEKISESESDFSDDDWIDSDDDEVDSYERRYPKDFDGDDW
jgi:hypothetical protein